ncbi:2'-5' RNA ligase family protein [Rufibacter latericius]|uniref:2'-5' RNA ligase family protein n=1 Tax=Rufibacter latericius TaxID=2487040 RepID=A0A3M9MD52_9BACT|nr:2'-5' RNA ligase family protein [Rufibacter latericius]RNI22518.1 2'-5' RNA ligase family protein [Rufibacter latericius]
MVAIVSLLDAEHSDRLNQLIFGLEREFGLREVQKTPYPHITWLTVNDGSLHNLQKTLGHAAGICCRFRINTTGLGIFPGEKPVLYIPVIRTAKVNQFHGQLYKAVCLISQEICSYYHPDVWMPHLSLALGDTSPEVVSQAIQYLNRHNFQWKIELDNLTLLTKNGDLYLKAGEFPLVGVEAKDTIKLTTSR